LSDERTAECRYAGDLLRFGASPCQQFEDEDNDEDEARYEGRLVATEGRRDCSRRSNKGTPAPNRMRAPMTQRSQYEEIPTRIRELLMMVTRKTPTMVPKTVPCPPVMRVPPSTTAAMTLSSLPTRSKGLA